MEGVDAPLELNVPVGILHRRSQSSPSVTSDTWQNSPEAFAIPSEEATADDDERSAAPMREKATMLQSYGLYALIAAMVVLCAFLGYRGAVKRHRPKSVEQQEAPLSVENDADTLSVETMENNEDGEVADIPADNTEVMVDEQATDFQDDQDNQDNAAAPPSSDDTVPAEDTSVVAESEMDDAVVDTDDQASDTAADTESIMLDAAPLSKAYKDSGISIYRCRMALKDFETSLAMANAEAQTNRAHMAKTAAKYIKSGLERAQANGDFEKFMAFKKALDTVEGAIEGDMEEIEKLRTARDKRSRDIDRALIGKGVLAAKSLNVALEWQKRDLTQKGDLDQAKKIAAFQKEIAKWMTETQSASERNFPSFQW